MKAAGDSGEQPMRRPPARLIRLRVAATRRGSRQARAETPSSLSQQIADVEAVKPVRGIGNKIVGDLCELRKRRSLRFVVKVFAVQQRV